MLQQILVLDPAGPLIIERTYAKNDIDPHIISGFLAAVLPRRKKLGYDLEKINSEMNQSIRTNTYFESVKIKKWIVAGFATKDLYTADMILLLNDIGNIVYQALGQPIGYSMVEKSVIDSITQDIDNLLVTRQIRVDTFDFTEDIVFDIISDMYRGRIKINEGIDKVVEAVETGNYDIDALETMIKAMYKIDRRTKKKRKR